MFMEKQKSLGEVYKKNFFNIRVSIIGKVEFQEFFG